MVGPPHSRSPLTPEFTPGSGHSPPAPTWSCAAVSPWNTTVFCSQASHSLGPALATFSLRGGTMSLQLHGRDPQPLPSCSLCLFPPGKAGGWPSPRPGQPFGVPLVTYPQRRARTPAPCPAQQASALLCPLWSQKGQVCSRGLGLAPHCCSLTSDGTSVGSVVPAVASLIYHL